MEESFETIAVAKSSDAEQAPQVATPDGQHPQQAQLEASTPGATAEKAPTQPDPATAERQRIFSQQQEKHLKLRQEDSEAFVHQELIKAGAFNALANDPTFKDNLAYIEQVREHFKDSPASAVAEHVDKARVIIRFAGEHHISPEEFAQLNAEAENMTMEELLARCDEQIKAPSTKDTGVDELNKAISAEKEAATSTNVDTLAKNPESAYNNILLNGIGKAAQTAYFEARGIKDLPEDPAERQKVIEDFIAFYKQYLVDVQDSKYKQRETTFSKSMKRVGLNYAKRSYENSDSMEFIRALLIQYDTRSSGHRSYLGDEYEKNNKQQLTTEQFKRDICNWSTNKEDSEKNKKNWIITCALLYDKLENPDSTNPLGTLADWGVESDQAASTLDHNKIKEKMAKLHAKCLEGDPSKINIALKGVLTGETYKNRVNTRLNIDPNTVAVSSDLLTSFQMISENTRYGQLFFE